MSFTCPHCGAARAADGTCPGCGAEGDLGAGMETRHLAELAAEARHIAGERGPVLVEAVAEPTEQVIKGIGAVVAAELISPFFLVPSRRFTERYGRAGVRLAEVADSDDESLIVSGRLKISQTLKDVQLAMIAGEAGDVPQVQPMLERMSMRGTALCLVAQSFSRPVAQLLVNHHHRVDTGCTGLVATAEEHRALYRLGGSPRRTTGFFGKNAIDLGQVVDMAEVRAGKLLLFNHSTAPLRGFEPAALIRIGRRRRGETFRMAHQLRRALLDPARS